MRVLVLRKRLGLREKINAAAMRAPDGDSRDWDQVRAWTDGVASEFHPREALTRRT